MQDLRVSPATGIGHRLIKCLVLIIVIILSSVNHLCEQINNESGVFNLHFVPFLRVVVSVFRLFSVLFLINGTSDIKSSVEIDNIVNRTTTQVMFPSPKGQQ
jgi:hypothetical protein